MSTIFSTNMLLVMHEDSVSVCSHGGITSNTFTHTVLPVDFMCSAVVDINVLRGGGGGGGMICITIIYSPSVNFCYQWTHLHFQ